MPLKFLSWLFPRFYEIPASPVTGFAPVVFHVAGYFSSFRLPSAVKFNHFLPFFAVFLHTITTTCYNQAFYIRRGFAANPS